MSNDNDPIDDAMREIEAALEILIDRAAVGRGVADQRVKVLALIRSKLPQPDAEHERAVEAWRKGIESAIIGPGYEITDEELAEALRLMRARPAVQEPTNPSQEAAALVCPQCRSGRDVEQTCMGILSGYDANRATCWACNRTGIVDDWKLIEQARRARPASGKDENR